MRALKEEKVMIETGMWQSPENTAATAGTSSPKSVTSLETNKHKGCLLTTQGSKNLMCERVRLLNLRPIQAAFDYVLTKKGGK